MRFDTVALAGAVVWITLSAPANAVTCPATLPKFSALVDANSFTQDDCQSVPVQTSILGPSLAGNADATGTAALGSLKAIAHASYDLPAATGFSLSASDALLEFDDTFPFLAPGALGFDVLAFTLSLSGSITTAGNPGMGTLAGGVMAELGVSDSASGIAVDADEVILMGPGIVVARIRAPLGLATDIDVTGILRIFASASGPGNVTTDFSDTFDLTKIQLFDSAGNLLDGNVVLTDAVGGMLPTTPTPTPNAAPEPSSAVLLTGGLALLALARRRSRPGL